MPKEEPGLISYDSYWDFLQANAVQRAVPEIREVIDVSKVVEGQIQKCLHTPEFEAVGAADCSRLVGPTARYG